MKFSVIRVHRFDRCGFRQGRYFRPGTDAFDIVPGPFADLFDLLAHHLGGWRDVLGGFNNVAGFGLSVAVDEGFKNSVFYCTFYLGTGKVLALIYKLLKIEVFGIECSFRQVNPEYLLAVLGLGKIDEMYVGEPDRS